MKMKCFAVAVLVLFWGLVCEKVQAKDRLVIGYTAITGIKAGLWVAEDAGIFDKHNIQAELLLITSASKMVQAMLGGDVPFAAAVAPNAAVYTYGRSQGNFAGVSLEGTGIASRDDANEEYYGKPVYAADILEDKVAPPAGAQKLVDALSKY